MDAPTRAVYEAHAADWMQRRKPTRVDAARALARRSSGPSVDLGCGPGWHAGALTPPVIALDAAFAMVTLARANAPDAFAVQGDLEALPLRRASIGAAWARNSYVHLPRTRVPAALAELHAAMRVGASGSIAWFLGEDEGRLVFPGDDFAGRYFSRWDVEHLRAVIDGAGFDVEATDFHTNAAGEEEVLVHVTRARTLPDVVGPDLRLLVCGLNPSIYAADAGVGFARPGNRFWPAAIAAGIVTKDRDPHHAFRHHHIGFTDLVKRATRGAGELTATEYRAGYGRVERLVRWLRPGAVVFVGLAGWRAAVDRGAQPGAQPDGIGGRPAYVMPSTSGLNARVSLDELRGHLAAAAALA